MDYKIIYPEAFPIVEFHLKRGESIKAESDAMIAMSARAARREHFGRFGTQIFDGREFFYADTCRQPRRRHGAYRASFAGRHNGCGA